MTDTDPLAFAPDVATARRFFQARADYAPSPLVALHGPDGCAVLAKDETNRLGLGAFKALGAPYAVARILDHLWQAKTGAPLPKELAQLPGTKAFVAAQTFVCASAGNHGMGVAAGARDAGAQARIYLARTVPEGFADRLRAIGAQVVRAGDVYEDAVAAAIEDTQTSGAILLADGTWPGYTHYPKWVMEGYCIIAEELRESFERSGAWPSHVYLQAGVGGLAAAMAHMIRQNWAVQPELVVVEPEFAACLQASHLAGKPIRGEGPESVMGRLDCKDPSIVAWAVLERCDVRYATLSEDHSVAAATALAHAGLPTTPSGGAGFGAIALEPHALRADPAYRPLIIVSERPN